MKKRIENKINQSRRAECTILCCVFGSLYKKPAGGKRGKEKMKEFDGVNMVYGLIATVGAAVFGKYWFLFAGFLIMNAIDYATGYVKAKYYNRNESSAVGAKGVAKKVWYWVIIGMAFFIAHNFVYMGEIIGINLSFMQLFGWFTLATYLMNEIRSILENLLEMEVRVPAFLVAGLDVAQKLLDAETNRETETNENNEENEE